MNNNDNDRKSSWLPALFYTVLSVVAIALPIALWQSSWPIIQNTYGKQNELKELLGFSGALALLIVAAVELGKRRKESLKKLAPIILWLLVSFHFLMQISEYSARGYDYFCYEHASERFRHGQHPYHLDEYFVFSYPPLPALGISWAYGAIQYVDGFSSDDEPITDEETNYLVYYFYQCAQLLLLMLCYWLCYFFARRNGLDALYAALLVTALLLLSNPLFRTLKHNQLNLWMLAFVMFSILLYRRRPILGGLAVALGAHIKLYPFILAIPLAMTRRWRAISATAVASLVIAIGIASLQDWYIWQIYFEYCIDQFLNAGSVFGSHMFRNNCIPSLVHNTLHFSGIEQILGPQQMNMLAGALSKSILLGLAAWFAGRFYRREKIFKSGALTINAENYESWDDVYRMNGHFMDAVAFTLLAMPMVWEHHYVLAMPIVIWAAALLGQRQPWRVALAAALIFAIPTFDVFPLSYHRFAALIYLMLLTSPMKMANCHSSS